MNKQLTKIKKEPTKKKDIKKKDFKVKKGKEITKSSFDCYQIAVWRYLSYIKDQNLEMGYESIKKFLANGCKGRNGKTKAFQGATANLYFTALKSYFEKKYEHDPLKLFELREGFDKIKTQKRKEKVVGESFLTLEQVKALCDDEDKLTLIIEAYFWTGCRVSELLNIKLADCRKRGGRVQITYKMTKNRSDHIVEIPLALFKKIKKFYKYNTKKYGPRDLLFPTFKNTPFDKINITTRIKKHAIKILGEQFSWVSAHTLRHSCAMYLKDEMGLLPHQIQKALGHSDVATTIKYYFHDGIPSADEKGIPDTDNYWSEN